MISNRQPNADSLSTGPSLLNLSECESKYQLCCFNKCNKSDLHKMVIIYVIYHTGKNQFRHRILYTGQGIM